eukprot:INCI14294.3.p1 GENE.INCI14294.3~~INCI14294.3.p1  ORF type:complete len:357 (-),score=31.21 INCI14294.3:488-1558(-)
MAGVSGTTGGMLWQGETTHQPTPDVSMFDCSAQNFSGQVPDRDTINLEVAGAVVAMVIELSFLLVVAIARFIPRCHGLYHWLSIDHVVSFAVLTLIQSLSYFMSAGYGFASIYLPDELCLAQAMIRTFGDIGTLLECITIPYLAFLVIVKQTPFTVLNARYRVRSFLFVYGGAFLLTLVPVLIEFGSQQDIVVYAPQRRTGTCNFSPTCLIVVVLDFYVLLALVTVGAVYLTGRLSWRVLQIYRVGTGATRVRQLDVTIFMWRRLIFGIFVVLFLLTEITWIAIAFTGFLEEVPHFNYFLRFVDQAIGAIGLLPFLPPKALLKACIISCARRRQVGRKSVNSEAAESLWVRPMIHF